MSTFATPTASAVGRAPSHDAYVSRLAYAIGQTGSRRGVYQDRPPRFGMGSRTIGWSDAILSYPVVARAYDPIRKRPQRPTDVGDSQICHADVQDLCRRARTGTFGVGRPYHVDIPKPTFPADIDIDLLAAEFAPHAAYLTGRTRPLTIQEVEERALAGAAAWVFGAFYAPRFHTGMVGSRSDAHAAGIFSTLQQALVQTGRHVLVCLDLASFFDTVPIDRALDLLHRDTGYRHDRLLGDLLGRLLTAGGAETLPQGSPLSPLLANLYANEHIDRVAKRHGPYLRYVDDMLVCVESVAAGLAACDALRAAAAKVGLVVSTDKSMIVDLEHRRQYSMTGVEQAYAPTYLGFQVDWTDGRLEHAVTNRAIWKLHDNLRSATYDPRFTYHDDQLRPVERLASRTERYMRSLRGWFGWYGHARWTEAQRQAVACLLDLSIGSADRWTNSLQRLVHQGHAASELTLAADLGPVLIPGAAGCQVRSGADIHRGLLAEIQASVSAHAERWRAADAHPVALYFRDERAPSTPRSTVRGRGRRWHERVSQVMAPAEGTSC